MEYSDTSNFRSITINQKGKFQNFNKQIMVTLEMIFTFFLMIINKYN